MNYLNTWEDNAMTTIKITNTKSPLFLSRLLSFILIDFSVWRKFFKMQSWMEHDILSDLVGLSDIHPLFDIM